MAQEFFRDLTIMDSGNSGYIPLLLFSTGVETARLNSRNAKDANEERFGYETYR